jgi:hypothetical protein
VILKPLAIGRFTVLGVVENCCCPVESFLSTEAARDGLRMFLQMVAEQGLQNLPASWTHEASKKEQIYEFIKGPLRLFYFKGVAGQIAICTGGVRKAGRNADPAAVAKASRLRKAYFEAHQSNTLIVME